MFGDMKFGLFDRVRRDASVRLARAVTEFLPQLARRLGRLALSTTDLASERRLDDAARRFEAEVSERADRALAAFEELHYRLLRGADGETASSPDSGNTVHPLELLGEDELAEQILAQDLAASARHALESAYPSYLARLGEMFGQAVDEEGSALTARGFASAMVAALRPFGSDPILQEPLKDSLRLIATPGLAELIAAVDARMVEAGLLAEAPRIILTADTGRTEAEPPTTPDPPAVSAPVLPASAPAPRVEAAPRDEALEDDFEDELEPPVLSTPADDAVLPRLPEPVATPEPAMASPAVAQAVNALLGGARGATVLGIHPITGKRHPRAAFRQAELLPTVETIERDAIAFAHQTGTVPYSHDARSRFFRTLRDSMRASHIDGAQLATLDLVQAMFDYVNDDSRIPEPAKPLLWRLQMPSVTLACLDPGYLANDDHSMRSLVEHVAAIAIAYPDEMVRDGELYRRMQTLVRAAEVVAHAFQVRSRVLSERVAIEYSRATYGMGQLVSRVVRERRELDATAGQPNRRDYRSRPSREREQQVTQHLNELMTARLQGRNVPDSVRDFLYDVWIRHLRTRVLRDGEDSPGFKVALEVVDDLLWTLDGAGRRRSRRVLAEKIPKILQTLTQGIGDIGRRPEDFGPFFDEMFLIHLRRMQGRKSRRSIEGDSIPAEGIGAEDTRVGELDDDVEAWYEGLPADRSGGRQGRAAPRGERRRAGDESIELGNVIGRFGASRGGRRGDPVEPPVLSDEVGDLPAAQIPGYRSEAGFESHYGDRHDEGPDSEIDPTTDQAAHRLADLDTDVALLDDEGPSSRQDPAPRTRPGRSTPRPGRAREDESPVSAERSELKLRRLIDETSLADAPLAPVRLPVEPAELVAGLQPGDWLQLITSTRELVLAKVAWINERRTVTLLLQHPDRLILSRHLSALENRARRGRVFLVRQADSPHSRG